MNKNLRSGEGAGGGSKILGNEFGINSNIFEADRLNGVVRFMKFAILSELLAIQFQAFAKMPTKCQFLMNEKSTKEET